MRMRWASRPRFREISVAAPAMRRFWTRPWKLRASCGRASEMGVRQFGASVMRLEDPRMLKGQGRYLDDISLPGLLHAAFVRSQSAHAKIRGIDTSSARELGGVAAIYTAKDLEAVAAGPLPQLAPHPALKQSITYHPL